MNVQLMTNMITGIYNLNLTGKGDDALYEAMDYDHWVYAMNDDKPVNFLKCTYGDKETKKQVMKKLPKEVKNWVKTSTDEVWAELYSKSWDLWNKEYYAL